MGRPRLHPLNAMRNRLAGFGEQPGCWLWTGHKYQNGYGHTQINRRSTTAHRKAFLAAGGTLKPGQEVCHRCDVRLCIRPDHLFAGTRSDNVQDMLAKGRGLTGEKSHRAKLTAEEAWHVKHMRAPAITTGLLYGVSKKAVEMIRQGRSWKGLPG